ASGGAATFVAANGTNTIEISDASYLALIGLTLDGGHRDGPFGICSRGDRPVHHLRIEDCFITDYDGNQQMTAISNHCPSWNWTIRGNRIERCGTGMYFATNGMPFIAGVIARNLVIDPLGYCLQIQNQKRPSIPGMPTAPSSTVIRDNVLIKSDRPSPDGDRPNLLLDGFPGIGPGSDDRYEVFGNLICHNPREALVQASGRVSIHDNLIVDGGFAGIVLMDHQEPLRVADIYHNTIVAVPLGVRSQRGGAARVTVTANAIFADEGVAGALRSVDNLIAARTGAASALANPSPALGEMDLHPLPGACLGTAVDLAPFAHDVEAARDFDGSQERNSERRGAYGTSGAGAWRPGPTPKP
ncbi:MAG: hypothetical protein H0W83_01475, partial [Planctomycetes bacterium]|nr:hypothetical protein [Planctomycetota bacterium]